MKDYKHQKNTQILLHNGKTKAVQYIKVGDVLMGHDSKTRTVLELHTGTDNLYEIQPKGNRAEPFVVNGGHILHLARDRNQGFIDITVEEYLKQTKGFKTLNKLTRAIVNPNRSTVYDPYILGIIQALGSIVDSKLILDRIDFRLLRYLKTFCRIYNFTYTIEYYKHMNRTYTKFIIVENVSSLACDINRVFELLDYSILPYKLSDRQEFLAGAFDACGSSENSKKDLLFNKAEGFYKLKSILNSVGSSAYYQKPKKGSQFLAVSGDLSFIPAKLQTFKPKVSQVDLTRIGFNVKELGEGTYYEFTVDKDNLYLTADYIIHRNSYKRKV